MSTDAISALHCRLEAVHAVDASLEAPAWAHIDDLTKPPRSLGRLEQLAAQLFVIFGGQTPLCVDPVRHYTLAGDHGVVAEGITSNPPEVTRQMVQNFLHGGAGINVLCESANIELRIVDAGCAGPAFADHPLLLHRRIASGTANMAHGPAMSPDDCARAVLTGMELTAQAAREGIRCLSTGEMGIGNTTPSSALFAAFLGLPVSDVTGPGAGLGTGGLAHKIAVIERSLAANAAVLTGGDALEIFAALGGHEIAGMAGVMLGAAEAGLPVLVDGFIAQAAFVGAWKLCPAVDGYAVFAHTSAEPGSRHLLSVLKRVPLLDLGLRLGEGTGCALTVPILRGACAMFNSMASFGQAGVTRA